MKGKKNNAPIIKGTFFDVLQASASHAKKKAKKKVKKRTPKK